ncbi:MAG: DUF814 domain-containing protein [Trueperaceae bacterium]|nr:DUF814 domain-containing protein [Trueperaceae bacterium]
MEGLLLAEVLSVVAAGLPSGRSAWRFPDDRICELTIDGGVLRIESRPGRAKVVFEPGGEATRSDDSRLNRRPLTSFQTQLTTRASGDLIEVSQVGLDRVACFRFSGSDGFVPAPPVTLVLEALGPHANLVLVDALGSIIAIERGAGAAKDPGQRSGQRRLAVGLAYRPPDAQSKLDPRAKEPSEMVSVMVGLTLEQVRRVVDGIGSDLLAALAAATGLRLDAVLEPDEARRVAEELTRLSSRPSDYLESRGAARPSSAAAPTTGVGAQVARERLEAKTRKLLDRELKTIRARLADAVSALTAAASAAKLRAEGDLLLANAADIEAGVAEVELTGFAGERQVLALDPKLSAADNAQERYHRARRVEARARAAEDSLEQLRRTEEALLAERAAVPTTADAALNARLRAATGPKDLSGSSAKRDRAAPRGIEVTDPRGYRVLIGRAAKENDEITFRRARSRDLWFHAQGYRGAHVVVIVGGGKGEQVPFETVLFAARLAAGHSEARQSENVPVDYTQRKNVWRKPGGAPGAVNYAHHKTVYVTPARDAAAAAG